ncbi:MAG: KilA-N domain-containing protein [Rhodoferax sp.]|uniref:KilA-N domain-containing protein n=1 Tax=Rhodoferax sp. TaxID=50421 RepID=UPI00182E908E|nr:KilA-N domain-containing protein [Rhodoferax sp.]NMM13783.1 KilA-N domain-containing protein [Rhodoferax sp.]
MSKNKILLVQSVPVTIIEQSETDYISLTDMVRQSESGSVVIDNWLRNKNTLEFLSVWEEIYNPGFNSLEFEEIKKDAGLNRFTMSVKQWITRTHATGVMAKAGRYGGTYAHKDIAFEFASWISPKFKLYLIKEFQRLKDDEIQSKTLEWNLTRSLSKINYRIHTDAIAQTLIPASITPLQTGLIYASEADVLNAALFGMTAKQWREQNPNSKGNIRDCATVEQLVVLSNLESINAELIRQGVAQVGRLKTLNATAIYQMRSLLASPAVKKLK